MAHVTGSPVAHLAGRHVFQGAPTPIRVSLFRLDGENQTHNHDFMEVAVVLEGQGLHTTIYGENPMRPGDVYLLRPGAWHAYRECRQLAIYNCCFGVDLLQRELAWTSSDPDLSRLLWPGPLFLGRQNILHFSLPAKALRQCREMLDRLGEAMAPGTLHNRGDQLGYLLLFLGELSRHLAPADREPAQTTAAVHPSVGAAIRMLADDLAHPWTLTELAERLNIGPSYLVRRFKDHTGLPPMAYLSVLRAERAASLLLRTDRPVGDIGRDVGWDDPNYFARRFRARFGVSATRYRKRFHTIR